ncbi:hypothetical protein I4R72_005548 [Salmonella enterica]|nr:hypothetical protein [Salmonella enterica]EIT8745121.1 hypothetical protein [Salmonella enterica]
MPSLTLHVRSYPLPRIAKGPGEWLALTRKGLSPSVLSPAYPGVLCFRGTHLDAAIATCSGDRDAWVGC